MPAPTVTCAICHATVNKRQTVSIGGNKRACREHSEAQSQADLAQQERKHQESQGRERKRWRPAQEDRSPIYPSCMNCRRKGLRQDDFYYQMMLLQEKYELVYNEKINFLLAFTDEQTAKIQKALAPLKDLECLWIIQYEPAKHVFLTPSARAAASFLGLFLLCSKCCKAFKVEHGPKAIVPDMNLEQLYLIGSMIGDSIREQAKQELEQAN